MVETVGGSELVHVLSDFRRFWRLAISRATASANGGDVPLAARRRAVSSWSTAFSKSQRRMSFDVRLEVICSLSRRMPGVESSLAAWYTLRFMYATNDVAGVRICTVGKMTACGTLSKLTVVSPGGTRWMPGSADTSTAVPWATLPVACTLACELPMYRPPVVSPKTGARSTMPEKMLPPLLDRLNSSSWWRATCTTARLVVAATAEARRVRFGGGGSDDGSEVGGEVCGEVGNGADEEGNGSDGAGSG